MLLTGNRRLAAGLCRVLLASAGLEWLWVDDAPTKCFDELCAQLSRSERAAGQFVWSIWSGDGPQSVSELVADADANFRVMVGTLLVASAYGDQGLQDWLAVQGEGIPASPSHAGPDEVH